MIGTDASAYRIIEDAKNIRSAKFVFRTNRILAVTNRDGKTNNPMVHATMKPAAMLYSSVRANWIGEKLYLEA